MIICPMALAGGQGKTTVAMMLGRFLANRNNKVLLVDTDPQSSLTSFLGVSVTKTTPSLTEVLMDRDFDPLNAIAKVPNTENLYLIPADDALEAVNYKLAATGNSLTALKSKLTKIAHLFNQIIVDPPPERSHLALTALGAADKWVIPAEANVKGVQSLIRTKALIGEMQEDNAVLADSVLLGVIPFRARWVGNRPTHITQQSITAMTKITSPELMLPHILYSNVYEKAINTRTSPTPELEYPIEFLANKVTSNVR